MLKLKLLPENSKLGLERCKCISGYFRESDSTDSTDIMAGHFAES